MKLKDPASIEAPQANFHYLDSKNNFILQFGVEMKGDLEFEERQQWWRRKERKRGLLEVSEERERRFGFLKKWFFFSFSFSFQKQFHMSFFNWSKKDPPFPLI